MDEMHVSPMVSPLKMLLKFLSFIEYSHTEREGYERGNKYCPLLRYPSLCDSVTRPRGGKKDYKNEFRTNDIYVIILATINTILHYTAKSFHTSYICIL